MCFRMPIWSKVPLTKTSVHRIIYIRKFYRHDQKGSVDMDKVYITGHRNPDTDSIISAMAYAALKNALGQRQYCAARLGQISDETQAVLDRFDAKRRS